MGKIAVTITTDPARRETIVRRTGEKCPISYIQAATSDTLAAAYRDAAAYSLDLAGQLPGQAGGPESASRGNACGAQANFLGGGGNITHTYILQASVDGINIDYEQAIQAAAEPDFWSLEEIAEAHGCTFWTCEEVRP